MKSVVSIVYGISAILFVMSVHAENGARQRGAYDTTLDSARDKSREFPREMQLKLQDAIQLGLKYSPLIRSQIKSLERSLAQNDVTLSEFNTKVDIGADAAASFTNTKQSAGSGGEVSNVRQNLGGSSTVSRLLKNGTRLTLTGEAEAIRDGDERLGDHFDSREDLQSSLGLSVDIPINSRDRLEIFNQLRSSEIDTEISENNLFLDEKDLVRQIIDSYWNVILQEEFTQIQRDRFKQAERFYEIFKIQYELDAISEFTLAEAEIDRSNQEAVLLGRESTLANSYENFNTLLGIPISTQIDLTEDITTEPIAYDAETYVDLVMEHNVDVKNLRLSIEESENALTLARLGQQPKLTFSSQYGRSDEGSDEGTLGLQFTWPLIDGGLTKARIRAAEAGLEQAKISLWNLERRLVLEVYQDIRDIETEVRRIEILQTIVKQAEKNLEVADFQFENGRITFRNLVDNQIDLANSRTNLAQARVSYNAAVARLNNKIHDDYTVWIAGLGERNDENLVTTQDSKNSGS